MIKRMAIVCAIFTCAQYAAADSSSRNAVYDHSSGRNELLSVSADRDDTIRITIKNTCPAFFSYTYRGAVKLVDETPVTESRAYQKLVIQIDGQGSDQSACTDVLSEQEKRLIFSKALQDQSICDLSSHDVFIPHDDQYGGYQVEIGRLNAERTTIRGLGVGWEERLFGKFKNIYQGNYGRDKDSKNCKEIIKESEEQFISYVSSDPVPDELIDAKEMKDVVLLTTLKPRDRAIDFSGGFVVSDLTNPRYAIRDGAIIRDRNAEDRQSLALAAFASIRSLRFPRASLSFGIGIGEGSNAQYYIGPSYRSRDGKWFLTLGAVWGSIDRLPSGEQEGEVPSNDNVITNLSTRIERAGFFAISYSFLGGGASVFQKPFASAAITESGGKE